MKLFSIKKGLILFQLFFTLAAFGQLQKYTTANLNMRTAPSTTSKVMAVLPAGTSIKLEEDCDCPWIKIAYNGQIGYVSSTYLSTSKPTQLKQPNSKTNSAGVKYYINSKGERVQSPTRYDSPPAGATALCRDGTYSFSRSRRGTCSGHGGVARWL